MGPPSPRYTPPPSFSDSEEVSPGKISRHVPNWHPKPLFTNAIARSRSLSAPSPSPPPAHVPAAEPPRSRLQKPSPHELSGKKRQHSSSAVKHCGFRNPNPRKHQQQGATKGDGFQRPNSPFSRPAHKNLFFKERGEDDFSDRPTEILTSRETQDTAFFRRGEPQPNHG